MTSEELLAEHRKALAHHEAEAQKHRLAIAALEGTAVASPPAPSPQPVCNCAEHTPKLITKDGLTLITGSVSFWFCPVHGLMPPVQIYPTFPVMPAPLPVDPWQPVQPAWPPWYVQGHGGNCACGQCVPPVICGGVFTTKPDFAARAAAGFKVSIDCGPAPFAASGGLFSGTIAVGST